MLSQPLTLQPVHSIRDAINPCVPIIAAIIIGIFMQGVGLMYKLFESAIRVHLEELNEVAKEFLDKVKGVKEPARFSNEVEGTLNGYLLYMHVKAPLCTCYEEIVSKYGDLVRDIGNHWNEAGKTLDKLNELCERIKRHNENVRKLKHELLNYMENLIKRNVVPQLPGLIPEYYSNLVERVLFDPIVPEVVRRDKKFKNIDKSFIADLCKPYIEEDLKSEHDTLRVGGCNVGSITLDDWREHGVRLTIEVICEALKKYADQLDEYVNEGRKLIERAEKIRNELMKNLEYIAKARFLPLTKLCDYLKF